MNNKTKLSYASLHATPLTYIQKWSYSSKPNLGTRWTSADSFMTQLL